MWQMPACASVEREVTLDEQHPDQVLAPSANPLLCNFRTATYVPERFRPGDKVIECAESDTLWVCRCSLSLVGFNFAPERSTYLLCCCGCCGRGGLGRRRRCEGDVDTGVRSVEEPSRMPVGDYLK